MKFGQLSPRHVTRRNFLGLAGAAGVVQVAARLAGSAASAPQDLTAPVPAVYRFFNAAEARCVEALCERLIPEDASGPGALAAGVPRHLDAELAGDWGGGARAYRAGAWQPGTQLHDYHAPATPREVFRGALAAIDGHFQRRNTTFSGASQSAQLAYLRALEAGLAKCGAAQADVFFDLLVKMTVEGYFANPTCCARRHTLAWRMTGFPGACAHHAPPAQWTA